MSDWKKCKAVFVQVRISYLSGTSNKMLYSFYISKIIKYRLKKIQTIVKHKNMVA